MFKKFRIQKGCPCCDGDVVGEVNDDRSIPSDYFVRCVCNSCGSNYTVHQYYALDFITDKSKSRVFKGFKRKNVDNKKPDTKSGYDLSFDSIARLMKILSNS